MDATPRPDSPTALQLAGITLAGALLSGLAEAAVAVYRHRVDHLPTGAYVAAEVFWMTPLAACFALGAVGVLWMVVSAAAPRRWEMPSWGPAIAAGLATFSLVSAMSLGLEFYAKVILSAGVGLSMLRTIRAWPRAVLRSARVILIAVPTLMLAVAVSVPLLRRATEGRTLAGLPAPGPNAPNVLVVIWDTARALSMSLYGYERATTPVLDSLARHGVTFDHAFATSPWSLPSHASIFTGRYPHELNAGPRIPLDGAHPTIGEYFAANGYVSAGITANLFYGSSDYGIDRGFSMYDERPPITPRVMSHGWDLLRRTLGSLRRALGNHDTLLRRRASHVNGAFLAWLDRRGSDRPWLGVLNYFDAHEPYRAPAPYDTLFARRGARYWADETLASAPVEVTNELRDMYDGAIAYDDRSLGDLLDALRARGDLENTIIVVTSDHGEEFGERGPGLLGHNRTLYRHALQVPLVVVFPSRIAAGQRSKAVVSIRDIPATIADLALPGARHPFPGTALARLVAEPLVADTSEATRLAMTEKHRWATRREGWPTSWGSMFSVMDSTSHYIADALGGEQLFDMATDPFDAHDLAGQPDYQAHLARLRSVLATAVGPPDRRVARAGATPTPPAVARAAHTP